jgi:hypothetical protein
VFVSDRDVAQDATGLEPTDETAAATLEEALEEAGEEDVA